ncbi:MAG: hypothetical protein SFW35_03020 [Chitinophagales bacterium]|nr:hypothetical protein [Chitinophagales bacterium]
MIDLDGYYEGAGPTYHAPPEGIEVIRFNRAQYYFFPLEWIGTGLFKDVDAVVNKRGAEGFKWVVECLYKSRAKQNSY